jgi:hypothetical protein
MPGLRPVPELGLVEKTGCFYYLLSRDRISADPGDMAQMIVGGKKRGVVFFEGHKS